jgi:(2Fe-2S) ferredoxin
MTRTIPRYLMICTNRRYGAESASCAARSSVDIAQAIETGVSTRRIKIIVERSVCMGQCTKGPTLRLAPGGRFIFGKTIEDVNDVLDELESLCGCHEQDTDPLHLLGS